MDCEIPMFYETPPNLAEFKEEQEDDGAGSQKGEVSQKKRDELAYSRRTIEFLNKKKYMLRY